MALKLEGMNLFALQASNEYATALFTCIAYIIFLENMLMLKWQLVTIVIELWT